MKENIGAYFPNIGEAIAIFLTTLVIVFSFKRVIKYLRKHQLFNTWLEPLYEVLHSFSTWFIWGYGLLSIFMSLTEGRESFPSVEDISHVRKFFFVIAFAWLILLWKSRWEDFLVKRSVEKKHHFDKVILSVLGKFISVVVVCVAGLIILDIFGVPLEVFLTFGGIGGLAISWAAKDVIANFFGGIMIYVNRPFLKGELIKSCNKSFEGVVEEIGFYMTRIRSLERKPIYIPNALITDAIIENSGRMYNRRIKTIIGLRYCDVEQIESIAEKVKALLKGSPSIDQGQVCLVDFVAFSASSLDIEVIAFTKVSDITTFRKLRQGIFLSIAKIVKEHGAEIAFPTQMLYLEKDMS